MFRYLVVALALALTVAGATTASASWVTRDVNVRSGPGTGHHVRHVARSCTPVSVHGHRHGWVRVDTSRGGGWISARYVSNHRPRHCRATHRSGHHHRPQVHIYLHHQPQVIHRPHGHHHRPNRPHWHHHRHDRRGQAAVRGEEGMRYRHHRPHR
jgi:uncharacterized protein YraI